MSRGSSDGLDRNTATRPVAWTCAPIDERGALTILGSWTAIVAVLAVVGSLIVTMWESSRPGGVDADVNRWFERRRTDTWTTMADAGSALSDTLSVVVIAAVSLPIFLWLFRRWHEYAVVFGGLVLEVTAFIAVSSIVGRDRPPVEQLGGAPTNSFPSGHIAAAVVLYGGIALVVVFYRRRSFASSASVAAAVIASASVIVSRLYLGMHYPTDALGGVLLGLSILALMYRAVLADSAPSPQPHHLRQRSAVDHTNPLPSHEGVSAP